MSNADVLLRQDDETVDVPQTSQYQDSRPVIRGHKSQENAFARVGAERPALLVILVGRSRRDSARKHGKRGSHHRERPASKCTARHRLHLLSAPFQDIELARISQEVSAVDLMSSSTLFVRLARGFGFSLRFWRRSPVFAAASFPFALSGRACSRCFLCFLRLFGFLCFLGFLRGLCLLGSSGLSSLSLFALVGADL